MPTYTKNERQFCTPLPTIVDKKNAQNLSAAKRLKSLKGKKLQQVQRLINKRALLIQMIKSK